MQGEREKVTIDQALETMREAASMKEAAQQQKSMRLKPES